MRPTPQLPTPLNEVRAVDDGSTAPLHTPSGQLCGQCQSSGGSLCYCINCCSFLCKPCTDSHKRMATFKSHKLVPPEQADTSSKYNCSKHQNESLNIYCITCKCLICQDCELFSHYKHETKSVTSTKETIKAHLKSDFECLLKHLKSFQSQFDKIAETEQHIEAYPDKLRAFIRQNVKDAKHKDKLLKEVDTHYSEYSKAVYAEKDSVSESIALLESEIKCANQLMKNSKLSLLEFAVCAYESISSMKKLKLLAWNPNSMSKFGLLVCVRITNDKQSSMTPPPFRPLGSVGATTTDKESSPLKSTSSDAADILLVKLFSTRFSIDKQNFFFGLGGSPGLAAVFSWSGASLSNASSELLFPELSVSCDVIGQSTLAVPCTVTRDQFPSQHNYSWRISYTATGPCSVKAKLKLNGDVYRQVDYLSHTNNSKSSQLNKTGHFFL